MKRHQFLSTFIILISLPVLVYPMTTPNVAVSPDATNHYGGYTISGTLTGLNPVQRVEAGAGYLIIEFDSNTILPATIDPSLVLVKNVASTSVTVVGQEIRILSPVNIGRTWVLFPDQDPDFEIVISPAAQIRNPAIAGNYQLSVEATRNSISSTIDGPQDSNPYTISQSTSTISTPAVSPSPAIAGQPAAYNIAFNLGSGGFLTAGISTITVEFDPASTISTGSLSGVTVNSISATAVGAGDSILITSPLDIDNEESVTLNFAIGTGLENPESGGDYTLEVKTSSEKTFISSQIFIITDPGYFTISSVSASPAIINTLSEYEVEFITSSSGALTAGSDTIAMIFQPNTTIPASLSPSDVIVSSGGFSDLATAVVVNNADYLDQDTVFVVTPINIGNIANASVIFDLSAGIGNPSQAGNYTLQMRTSKDTGFITSNAYQIISSSTTVSSADVTPESRNPDSPTAYLLDFNLGSKGRLQPGVSTITVTFNSSFQLATSSSSYDSTRISVAGAPFVLINTTFISADNVNKTVEITVPEEVFTSNNDNIVLVIGGRSTDPITNPPIGTYSLSVRTSVETTNVSSASFAVGGQSVTVTGVSLTDYTVNNISQYTINFTLASTLWRLKDDYIKIKFPEGTVLPSSIDPAYITVDGNAPRSVSVSQSTRTVTISFSQPLLFGNISVVFTTTAGIINPAVPSNSFYQVIINTSQDIVPANSPVYIIAGDNTLVTGVTVSANPPVRNAVGVAYSVGFSTSTTGKLMGGTAAGSSTVSVDFDSVTVVPGYINPAYVKLNTQSVPAVEVLTAGNGGVVRLTLPNGLSINNNEFATVLFESLAGLSNRDFSGTFNLRVSTSSDTAYSDTTGISGDYLITDVQELSISSVSVNPSTQNAPGGYTIRFTTGSLGALSAGEYIFITFPSNTSLPAVINSNDILVNGANPPGNPVVAGNLLAVASPDTIPPLTQVTILINQTANILNPTLIQSYTLEIATSAESGPFTSPGYNVSQTSTTVSVANVSPIPASDNSLAKYTINFAVGNYGRLLAGTSTITVTFNGNTTVNPTPSNYDSTFIMVDGTATPIPTGNISINGQSVTLTVPAGISVDNQDAISLIINSIGATKPIRNPATSGNYTLTVRTSVETSNVTSNAFTISSALPVTKVSVSLAPDIVNASSADTISFRVQNPLPARSGSITVIFPFNTFLPTTITSASVRIANDSGNPNTFVNANSVSVNTFTRTVTITVGNSVSSGDSVRVAFLNSAGLQNPSIFGNYTLQVKTSGQPLEAVSTPYTLLPTTTSISGLTVNIDPLQPGQPAEFTYQFNTGSRGRLVSGVSTITLIFPYDVLFTQGVPATSKVTVNSTPAAALDLRNGINQNPDSLIVTVPASVTVGNNTSVTVNIDPTAGVRNATTLLPLTYQAFTSVETGMDGDDVSLPVELIAFEAFIKGKDVILQWQTASEIENAFWYIDRKILSREEYDQIEAGELELENSLKDYIRVATVEGQGSITSRTDYEYVDRNVPMSEVYAYRLADVSFNGEITFHTPVLVVPDAIPMDFALMQNYPNPFNPRTTIKYQLPEQSKVTFKIYNILGQEVVTLLDEEVAPGHYEVSWNGRNNFEQQVASGVYVYRIIAETLDGKNRYVVSKRMILLR